LAAGVAEPHAMTMSTADAEGRPHGRTLIVKDVNRLGWAFASTRCPAKGRQLAVHPATALSFWWPARVRAVRVRGPVVQAAAEDPAADLAARCCGA
jgi:pyridoxamine 5'-phosphate oxidase